VSKDRILTYEEPFPSIRGADLQPVFGVAAVLVLYAGQPDARGPKDGSSGQTGSLCPLLPPKYSIAAYFERKAFGQGAEQTAHALPVRGPFDYVAAIPGNRERKYRLHLRCLSAAA
jgi:hypothetical protein